MKAPIQAKPMPRTFMQAIVGRQWSPEAQARSTPEDLPGQEPPKGKGRRRKSDLCLRQLTTFAVRPRY